MISFYSYSILFLSAYIGIFLNMICKDELKEIGMKINKLNQIMRLFLTTSIITITYINFSKLNYFSTYIFVSVILIFETFIFYKEFNEYDLKNGFNITVISYILLCLYQNIDFNLLVLILFISLSIAMIDNSLSEINIKRVVYEYLIYSLIYIFYIIPFRF